MSQRKILHCDCDCFFAAVEMRDDPSLRGRPMAVGGSEQRRGVISTCNYEARDYGVHSAMATATAKKLCPELIVVPHHMDKYRQAAEQIREIFYCYADCVEPVSLDEAYLDVSDSSNCNGSATLMAQEIMARVVEEVGITISVGVASNKFLAKIASDWHKPNGLCVILPDNVADFVLALPIAKINGVGKVTAEKMKGLGVNSCGDLQAYSVFELVDLFGRFGLRLYDLCRGVDDRAVVASRVRKSLSVEHTYQQDLTELESCYTQLPELFVEFNTRLKNLVDTRLIIKHVVKLKFSSFQVRTVETTHNSVPRIADFRQLILQCFVKGNGLPVRLMGIGVRFADVNDNQCSQLPLFSAEEIAG